MKEKDLPKEKDKTKNGKKKPSLPGAFSVIGPDDSKNNTFGAEEMEETTIFDRKPSLHKSKEGKRKPSMFGGEQRKPSVPGAVSVSGPDSRKNSFAAEEKRKSSVPGAFSVSGPDSTKNTFGAEEMQETTIFDRKPSLDRAQDEKRKPSILGAEQKKPSLPGAFSVRGPDSTKNAFAAEEMQETTISNRKPSLDSKNERKKKPSTLGAEQKKPSAPGAFSVTGPDSTKNTFGAEEMMETTISDRKPSLDSKNEKRKPSILREEQRKPSFPGAVSVSGPDSRKSSFAAEEKRKPNIPGAVSVNGPDSTENVFAAEEMPETTISGRKQDKSGETPTKIKPRGVETRIPGAVSMIAAPNSTNEKLSVGELVETNIFDRQKAEKSKILSYAKEGNDTTTYKKTRIEESKITPPSKGVKRFMKRIRTPGMSKTQYPERNVIASRPDNVAVGPGASQGGRIDDKMDNLQALEYNHADTEEVNEWKVENKQLETKPTHRKKMIIGIILAITILAIGLGVGLSFINNPSNDQIDDQIEPTSCDFEYIPEFEQLPIAWKSCHCNNYRKADIPERHLLKYNSLKASFIQKSILPVDFDDRTEVCDVRSIALLWLAEDAIDSRENREEDSMIRRFALALLYLSTTNKNPDQWTNKKGWMTFVTECNWAGISCNPSYYNNGGGKTLHIKLDENNLVGTIPPEISLLNEVITVLRLTENKISGSIPSEIGLLTKLNYLGTNKNTITGIVPSEIGLLSELENLILETNSISGAIPTEIGLLTNSITVLTFESNKLQGTIPTEIGQISSLVGLDLSSNQLNGTIPSEIGNLESLLDLKVNDNQLTGKIPPNIGQLLSLEKLDFESNKLGGTIPTELGSITNLKRLNLDSNNLSGTIPTELGNCQKLSKLFLESNTGLEGTMPSEIWKLPNLKSLNFCSTGLTGTIPEQISTLQNVDISCDNCEQKC